MFTHTHLDNNADKSSDEQKTKDSELNEDFNSSSRNEQTNEASTSSNLNSNNLSPIRYRRGRSLVTDSPSKNRNKKAASWFNFLPSYKVRAEEFKKHFGHIVPSNERFIVDYSCAYQREILAQGRMYISLNYICFYANIFSWETNLVIKCKDIKQIYKTNTALIIPNAVEIVTNSGDKYFFASYVSREKAFLMLFKIWQNALLDVKLDAKEILETNKLAISEDLIWEWIHDAYGNYLGYTEEEEKHQKSIISSPSSAKDKLVNDSDSSSDSELYLDSDTFNEVNDLSKQIDLKMSVDKDGESSFSCCCEEHEGSEIFNETFPLTVDQMFTLAFDDSPFFRMIQKQRKSTVLFCEPWRDVDELKNEDELGRERTLRKTRELRLKIQLDNALAKSVDVCEVQYLDEKSVPGYYYMINSKCQNSGVPFADTFQVHNQFCFSRGSTVKECNLVVHTKVEFVKSGFGLSFMKSTIENSSLKGVADYCKFLSQQLNNWCKEKSLERRQNLNFQQFKQLQYDSSNEDNQDDDEEDDNDDDFVLSNDYLAGDVSPLIKTNSINRKVFDGKRKRFKSSSISTLNSARIQLSKHNTPFWKLKNNELILFVIFIILLLILVLILFLFKRLWQLEIIIRKYEEDLISFERIAKLASNLNKEESFKQFFNQSNATVIAQTWKDLINQTESTIRSIKSIYLDKNSLE